MQDKEHILQVKMLGGIAMEYDQSPICFEKQYFSKSIQLFLLLLLHRETGMKKEEVLECLYGRREGTDINNNLNNMVSRLRKQLKELGLPREDDILIKGGRCMYVSNSRIQVDVWDLERLVEQAGALETGREEKRSCLLEAVSLYQGDFLPQLSAKTWAILERMRCKQLYETALRQLEPILTEEGNFPKLYELYSLAAGQYPLEGYQEKQIQYLLAMDQEQRAFQVGQETARSYSNQLGMPLSQESRKQLWRTERKLFGYAKSLEGIQKSLQEEEREPGAYYCSYPSFLDCSILLARNGKKTVLLMCTLEDAEAEEARTEGACGKHLSRSIQECLRRVDIYTRYSSRQYLALLMETDQENIPPVLSRITRRYRELSGNSSLEIRYEISASEEFWRELASSSAGRFAAARGSARAHEGG